MVKKDGRAVGRPATCSARPRCSTTCRREEAFSFGAFRTFQVPVRRIAELTGLGLEPHIAADPLERLEATPLPRELIRPGRPDPLAARGAPRAPVWHARRHGERTAPPARGRGAGARAARRDRDERRRVAPVVALLRGEREVWSRRPARVRPVGGAARGRAVRDRRARRRRGGVLRRGRAGAPARGRQLARRRRGPRAGPPRRGRVGHRDLARRLRGRGRRSASPGASLRLTYWAERAAAAGRAAAVHAPAAAAAAVRRRCSPTPSSSRPARRTTTSSRCSTARASSTRSPRSTAIASPARSACRRRSPGARATALLLPSQALRARRLLPDARHVWLHGCGHVPMSDDPDAGRAVLLEGSAEPPPRVRTRVASASG